MKTGLTKKQKVTEVYYNSKDPTAVNCTPFVRQVWYNTCTKKWGVFLCRREYQTSGILVSLSKWL